MKDVSIVVVNWNTRDILRNCLRSVYEQTKVITFEVIVIDNASSDDSALMVKEEFPQVILIENLENRGFAAANNQGMTIAQGRYVLLLNSDTVILDDVINKAILFADACCDAAVVGCRVLNADKTLQRTCFMFPSVLNTLLAATYLYKLFPRNRFFGRERMTWWNYDSVREIDVVTGCFMLVRRQAIEQVGLFDERFFFYSEETDWCYRFKKKGWKVIFNPNGEIIHLGGQTTRQMPRKFRWQLHGSELIFMKIHKSWLEFIFARLFMAMFLLFRVPYWFTVAIFNQNEKNKAMDTTGTYLIGAFLCLFNWRQLLMNKQTLKGQL